MHPTRLFLVHRKRKAVRANTHSVTRPLSRKTSTCSGTRGFALGAICLNRTGALPAQNRCVIDRAALDPHPSERNPHFYENLPAREHWRLSGVPRRYGIFDRDYGIGRPEDYISTIVLYDGQQLRHYVHGINMDHLAEDVARYDIVSYNGKSFDAPFIRRCLQASLISPI